jgi:hypothetical protein
MKRSPVTRHLAVAAHAGLAASLIGATALHLGWSKQVNTVRHAVSEYALAKGADRVFAGTVASLTAGSAALLAGLVRSRLPVGASATALLGAWCGGLALSGIFPTDPLGVPPTARGLAHRYAAGTAIAALPAVGVLAARRLGRLPGWAERARRLRRTSWASAAACLGFFATHLCMTATDAGPKVRAVGNLLGLAERVALGLELSLLYQLAGAVLASKEGS